MAITASPVHGEARVGGEVPISKCEAAVVNWITECFT
jgi:hypothetical protein